MSQIEKRNIEPNAVGAAQARLENSSHLRGRNAADNGDVNMMRVNGANVLEFPSVPQIASGTPTNPNDVATIGRVQEIAAGLRDPKDACRVASAGSNIALSGGTTLTIDDIVMVDGDRVLLKDQTVPAENGAYVVGGIGAAYTLTRTNDFDEDAEVTQGASIIVVEGTINTRTGFVLNTQDPITIGVTGLTFVAVPVPDNILFNKETIPLTATDISNQFVDLSKELRSGSLRFRFNIEQDEGGDYTLSTVANVTRVTFAGGGDLATGGPSELVEGDVVVAAYAF